MQKPLSLIISIGLILGGSFVSAKPNAVSSEPLTAEGEKLRAEYTQMLSTLQEEIKKAIPEISVAKNTAFTQARENAAKVTAQAEAAQAELGKIGGAKGMIDHAKGKWIGGAEKGIA
ncbi:MAG: hypothetical protein ACK49X_02950, partial [Akkermansiaceae bacterium]